MVDSNNVAAMSIESIVGIVHVGEGDAEVTVHLIGITQLVMLEKPLIDLWQVEDAGKAAVRGSR